MLFLKANLFVSKHLMYICVNNAMPTWPLTKNIKFKTPFEKAPTVTYGLSYIDIDVSSQDRVRSEVASVTNAGFQFTVTTWQYSKLWGARATWIACGI